MAAYMREAWAEAYKFFQKGVEMLMQAGKDRDKQINALAVLNAEASTDIMMHPEKQPLYQACYSIFETICK